MDMSYIMDSGQNRLYTTFPNILLLISVDPADSFHIQKIIFQNKSWFFDHDNTLVPGPHQHSLQTHKFDFWVLEYKNFTYILLDYLQPNSQAKCK